MKKYITTCAVGLSLLSLSGCTELNKINQIVSFTDQFTDIAGCMGQDPMTTAQFASMLEKKLGSSTNKRRDRKEVEGKFYKLTGTITDITIVNITSMRPDRVVVLDRKYVCKVSGSTDPYDIGSKATICGKYNGINAAGGYVVPGTGKGFGAILEARGFDDCSVTIN